MRSDAFSPRQWFRFEDETFAGLRLQFRLPTHAQRRTVDWLAEMDSVPTLEQLEQARDLLCLLMERAEQDGEEVDIQAVKDSVLLTTLGALEVLYHLCFPGARATSESSVSRNGSADAAPASDGAETAGGVALRG